MRKRNLGWAIVVAGLLVLAAAAVVWFVFIDGQPHAVRMAVPQIPGHTRAP